MKVCRKHNKKILTVFFILISLTVSPQTPLRDTLDKERMYEDFDQFVEIVKKHNPQIAVRKQVTNYDLIARIQGFRPTIEKIGSAGEFYQFMNEMTACLIDMHAYMIKSNTPKPLVDYLYTYNTFKEIDTAFLKETNRMHGNYLATQTGNFFWFGNFLLYHDGKYYTMGDIKLFGKRRKTRIREMELVKVGEQSVDEYLDNSLHKQAGAFICWDYANRKYYSSMLTLPRTVLTMRDIKTNVEKSVDLSEYQNYSFRNPVKIKGKNNRAGNTVCYFQEEKILYIYIPRMVDGAQHDIIADIRAKMGNEIPHKVVLDVRGNPGGSDDVWIDIVGKLTKETISMPTTVGIRRQNDMVDFWIKSDSGSQAPVPFQFLGEEYMVFKDSCVLYPDSVNLGFTGLFYVLQDQGTKSAAHSLSSLCRYSPRFTSVGIPTGCISGRGRGPSLFQLKNSKYMFAMECDMDFTLVAEAVDCYQDMPEIELRLSLEDAIRLQFDFAFSSMSKSKDFLLREDPFFRKVLND